MKLKLAYAILSVLVALVLAIFVMAVITNPLGVLGGALIVGMVVSIAWALVTVAEHDYDRKTSSNGGPK